MRYATLLMLFVCSACGSGGSSPGATAAAPVPPAQPQTLTLSHGLGFVCTIWDGNKVYCWASQELAVTNGDAGKVGLTSTTPKLMFTSGSDQNTLILYDHGIYINAGGSILCLGGDNAAGTLNTYTSECTIDSTDSATCPNDAVSEPTFAWSDIRIQHYPHSPTWYAVRRAV